LDLSVSELLHIILVQTDSLNTFTGDLRYIALKAIPDQNHWVKALPLVLLGIRASMKQDINCTSAELVYGMTLCLPGEFFHYSDHDANIIIVTSLTDTHTYTRIFTLQTKENSINQKGWHVPGLVTYNLLKT